MKTSRKITLGFSYLLSACDDISISSPSLASVLRSAVLGLRFRFTENYFLRKCGLSPKCYNIRRK